MKINMNQWKADLIASPVKKALPVLSFPVIQLLNITVKELINSSQNQAKAMKMLVERNDTLAALSMMDLSVEAEAFGAAIKVTDDEVPVVIGTLVNNQEEAEALPVPPLGAGRTQIYLDAIKLVAEQIHDRPVLAGVIGPFSLAGRLIGTAEIMKACKRKPELVHTVMQKCTQFLIAYVNAYKNGGANGIVMAEPLTGLLPPKYAEDFSEPYVRQIVEAVQTDEFMVIYHNCGNNTLLMIESILRVGAAGYHFGNSVSMPQAITLIPQNLLCMGNIDPTLFTFGTADNIYQETFKLMEDCASAPNFVVSSGCDIPPIAKWENIDQFYQAVSDFYSK